MQTYLQSCEACESCLSDALLYPTRRQLATKYGRKATANNLAAVSPHQVESFVVNFYGNYLFRVLVFHDELKARLKIILALDNPKSIRHSLGVNVYCWIEDSLFHDFLDEDLHFCICLSFILREE